MDFEVNEISACREDIKKVSEDDNHIEFAGEGYRFIISKDPNGKSSCGCSGRLSTTERGVIRLYQCRECGARISIYVERTGVEIYAGDITSEDVARVGKAVIAVLWDGLQERDIDAFALATRISPYSQAFQDRVIGPVMHQIKEGYWDLAQICENGHIINTAIKEQPKLRADFCPKCSARTITACHKCGTDIRGQFHAPENPIQFVRPSFCHHCGSAYPWTEAIQMLKTLAYTAEDLSAKEQENLADCFDDLVEDTDNTHKAIETLKRCLPNVGKTIAFEMKDILVKVATEVVKAKLGI
jgi:hypothetical protein